MIFTRITSGGADGVLDCEGSAQAGLGELLQVVDGTSGQSLGNIQMKCTKAALSLISFARKARARERMRSITARSSIRAITASARRIRADKRIDLVDLRQPAVWQLRRPLCPAALGA